MAYARQGRVQLRSVGASFVRAEVQGEEVYSVELRGSGGEIDASCSCPAATRGFCKHMVAVALSLSSSEAHNAPDLALVRDYLATKSIAELVDIIVALAERDDGLLSRLGFAAAAGDEGDEELEKRLRRTLDTAIRVTSFIDYQKAERWASRVHDALDPLDGLLAAGRAAVVMRLALYALDRVQRALQRVDDSNGQGGALMMRARDLHRAAARVSPGDVVALAKELFAREAGDPYGIFDGSAAEYADVLGSPGLAEYRRLAEEAWGRLPVRGPRAGLASADYRHIGSTLDWFAERDGNIDLRIALHRKDLSSQWRYLQLAELCLSAGRSSEALRYVEEGLWTFEDEQPDERLVRLALDLLVGAERTADAETMAWRVFDRSPTRNLYRWLRSIGGDAAVARVIERLGRGSGGSDAVLLVSVLTEEGRFDAAWAAADKYRLAAVFLLDLAKASESTHAARVVALYKKQVEELLLYSDNQRYHEAALLVSRIAGLQGQAAQNDFLDDLRARHGRKRNFMKLLS